jgi:DNA polymerase III delta prime subunit
MGMEHENTYYAATGDKHHLTQDLANLFVTGRLGHAYIFCGREGLTQALALAQVVNCVTPRAGQPCGICPSCKKVTEGCHPDIRVLGPEKDAHRLESMRRLQADAYLQSYEGGKKLFILERAELLLEEAANNLLKVLEEPPEDTIFILVCADWDKLLPTIQSRCQIFSFGGKTSVVLDEAWLEGLLPQAVDYLQHLPNLTLTQAIQESRRVERDKEGWLHYLAALTQVLAQTAKKKRTLPFSPEKSLTAALMLEHTSDLLRRNINQKLLLDIIFLRLWQYVQSN